MKYSKEDFIKFIKERRYEVKIYVHSDNVINFYFNDKDYIQFNDYGAYHFIRIYKKHFKFRILRVKGKNKIRKKQLVVIYYLNIARKRKQRTTIERQHDLEFLRMYNLTRGYGYSEFII